MLLEAPAVQDVTEEQLDVILDVLRDHGLDTTYYRRSFLKRRVLLRIRKSKVSSVQEYRSLVEAKDSHAKDELIELTRSISLDVTEFLRNPEVWLAIKNRVFREWLKTIDRESTCRRDKKLRILSAGSSLGCEPYSFAILFHELLGSKVHEYDIRINAIDINAKTLERAKIGNIYDKGHLKNFSASQIDEYFAFDGNCYAVKDEIRDMVDFSILDLNYIGEIATWKHFEPFNLIACRNVLIYFDKNGQHKIIKSFHDLLQDHPSLTSYLVLGKTEGIYDKLKEHFRPLDLQTKIYIRVNNGKEAPHHPSLSIKVGRPTSDDLARTHETRLVAASAASFYANLNAINDGSLYSFYTYPFIWKKIKNQVFPILMGNPTLNKERVFKVVLVGNGVAPALLTSLAGWHHTFASNHDDLENPFPRVSPIVIETTPEFRSRYETSMGDILNGSFSLEQVKNVPQAVIASTFNEKRGSYALKDSVLDACAPTVFTDLNALAAHHGQTFPLVLFISRFKLDATSMETIVGLDYPSLVADGGFIAFHPKTHYSRFSLEGMADFEKINEHVALYQKTSPLAR